MNEIEFFMTWFTFYAQVYSWLAIPEVWRDMLKSIFTILIEGAFVLLSIFWILLSPLIALFGVCFPKKLLDFLKWPHIAK
jgi:hypothetical protein